MSDERDNHEKLNLLTAQFERALKEVRQEYAVEHCWIQERLRSHRMDNRRMRMQVKDAVVLLEKYLEDDSQDLVRMAIASLKELVEE